MTYSYKFNEAAQIEYEGALEWYLERGQKAAEGFVNSIDAALLKICTYPLRYRNTYKHFYEIGLKKYPFILIYSIEEPDNVIIVWKIFHHKRNPKRKYSGLQKK